MSKLLRLRLPELWNNEYPFVVNRIINIVLAHKPGELHLQRSYDQLAAFRPRLDTITAQERADIESAQLSELDQQRDTHYEIICSVVKAFKRSPIAWLNVYATRMQALLKKHGVDISDINYTAETQSLYNLERDMAAQTGIAEMLQGMALTHTFEQLNIVNKQFDTLFMSRNTRQSGEIRIDIRAIRLECNAAVTQLLNAIETFTVEYPDTDYTPLVTSLNNLATYYRQQLAARATRRREKADPGNEQPITPPEQ